MKVYVVFKEITNYIGNTDEVVLNAIFSKEEYAKQYCDKHNKKMGQYWYDEEYVDEELEELLNETGN